MFLQSLIHVNNQSTVILLPSDTSRHACANIRSYGNDRGVGYKLNHSSYVNTIMKEIEGGKMAPMRAWIYSARNEVSANLDWGIH
jgi:hypothetical protein